MTLTHPLAWGLLLLAIPIILFFLLKVRLRKELVTTTLFWQQVFEERRIRTLHRRFRYFASLILALLFLSCLTAALLDPVLTTAQNNRCVIIIDNSASMNARLPSSQTIRLHSAQQQALKRLKKLAAGQQAALLTANVNPKILSGFTNHTGTLQRKLAAIPATDYPADLGAALRLAEQLIADQPDSPIYIYTDAELPLKSNVPSNVHIVRVGLPIDNLAITRFQPRRLPEHAADYEILVEAVNFGMDTVQTRLEIDCEGEIVDVLPLSLEPGKAVTKIVRNTSAEGGLYRAKLASTDSFPADDVAIAFLTQQFVQHVLLGGTENFFLRHVLQVQPQTEVILIEDIPDSVPPESVWVFHQKVPLVLPQGNVMVIDPQNDCDLFQVQGRLEQPITANVTAGNPLVRFMPPGLVFSGAKNVVSLKDNAKVLAETAEGFPLYGQFVSENQRVLVLSADLNQGDFALRTAFPMLISQALTYFRDSNDLQRAYSTAEPVNLSVPTEKTQVILRSPSGREEMFPCREGTVLLGRLGECGVWTLLDLESGQELAKIACNLFNAVESNLRSSAEGVSLAAERDTWELAALFVRPLWHYLALLTLLLTAAEWFLYQRRWIE